MIIFMSEVVLEWTMLIYMSEVVLEWTMLYVDLYPYLLKTNKTTTNASCCRKKLVEG